MTSGIDDQELRLALTDASLDAPRVDLWGRLQAPTRANPRIRHLRLAGLRTLAAVLVVLLVSAGALAIAAQTRPTTRASNTDVTVPDTLLVSAWDEGGRAKNLQAIMPGTGQLVEVLDGVGSTETPLISPDGAQLIFTQSTLVAGQMTASLYAVDAQTLAAQWHATLAVHEQLANSCCGFSTTAAIAGANVYAITRNWYEPGSHEPAVLVSYDRATGQEQGRWTLDLGGQEVGSVRLLAARDGSALYVVASVATKVSANPFFYLAYQRFDLPSMTLAERLDPGVGRSVPAAYYDHITPDGKSLYSIGITNYASNLAVSFFDIASATPLDPIMIGGDADSAFLYQHTVSADGATLYAFNPANGDLSIFNLNGRALARSVSVDMSRAQGKRPSLLGRAWRAVQDLVAPRAAAKIYFQGSMQFSPDGSRLYAIGVQGNGIDGSPAGVLAIDATNWQVFDRWATDSAPVQLQLSADGRTLYAFSDGGYNNASGNELLLIDTSSGATHGALDLHSDFGGASIYTVADIYHEAWGQEPRVNGVASGSAPALKPFAQLAVSVDRPAIVSGDAVTVTARYVDPTTGAALEPDNDKVQFSPPDSMRATLSHGAAHTDDVTVVLTEDGYGVYRGVTQLSAPAVWDLRVQATRANEPNSSISEVGIVTVQSAFTGVDGRRYVLRGLADPPAPAAEQEFTYNVAFVDAETGAPLPEGVDIQGGLPESISASFFGPSGVTSVTLRPSAHGVYQGEAHLFSGGVWNASVNFRNDGVSSGATEIGTIVAK